MLPRDHNLSTDYYSMKRLIKGLHLSVENIDACKNDCMLYWKDDIDLEYCKFCGDARSPQLDCWTITAQPDTYTATATPDPDERVMKLEEMFMHKMMNLPVPLLPNRSQLAADSTAPVDDVQDDVDVETI
ncbi:UNVERIFIED_CONTAM: hypothetical protein Sradi_0746200 [Sesamum radiatum]|uniref:Uncharacterized protein n=1 Tax=Sesamum radiatum TaxID=300843 RepID=A0AAW2VNY6_SESRA